MYPLLRRFLLPTPNRAFFVRVAILALGVAGICRYVAQPVIVDGKSMEPTYAEHGVNLCLLRAYRDRLPERGDVVALRWGGAKWLLLKRVIAFEGETVEFRDGTCYVDGSPLEEPYVRFPCDWTIPPRTIRPGHIYVMGDNRSVPASVHVGGEISAARLAGRPAW